MTIEDRAEGAVGWSTYKSYLTAASDPVLMMTVIAAFILANASQIGQQWLVAAWTTDVDYSRHPLSVYLGSITAMAAAVAFFKWVRTYVSCLLGTLASKSLHFKLLRRVLNAPLNYFGTFA